MAIDIEGNCRFYDLLRFKKMAKISSGQVRMEGITGTTKFRLLNNVCMEMTQDAMFGVIQGNKIFDDIERPLLNQSSTDNANASPAKGGKGAALVEEAEPEAPLADTFEAQLLEEHKFSDNAMKFRSLENVV